MAVVALKSDVRPVLPRCIPAQWYGDPYRWLWTYRTESGQVIGHVVRYENREGKKQLIPFFHFKHGTWKSGEPPMFKPLFGRDRQFDPLQETLFIVEGEKCASAMHGLSLDCVACQRGSGAAHESDWSYATKFKRVIVLPDNDVPGYQFAADVIGILRRLGVANIAIGTLPVLPEGGDVCDWRMTKEPGWSGYEDIPREPGDERQNEFWEALRLDQVTT